jgi:hypothetical protein
MKLASAAPVPISSSSVRKSRSSVRNAYGLDSANRAGNKPVRYNTPLAHRLLSSTSP